MFPSFASFALPHGLVAVVGEISVAGLVRFSFLPCVLKDGHAGNQAWKSTEFMQQRAELLEERDF